MDHLLSKIKPFRKYDASAPVYIRYGVWSGRGSLNFRTGETERGLSVYPAIVQDGVVYPDEREIDISPCLIGQGRVVFAVQGKYAGTGSDGEPVLQGVKHVRLPIALTAKRI